MKSLHWIAAIGFFFFFVLPAGALDGPLFEEVTTLQGYFPAWADFDLDGDLDLMTCESWEEVAFIYRNESPGSFQEVQTLPCTWFTRNSQPWGDYDRDGDPDLALPTPTGVMLYRNEDGIFMKDPPAVLIFEFNTEAWIHWADMDRKNGLDLLLNTVDGTVLYLNDGRGTLRRSQEIPPRDRFGANVGDFDGDGYPDLLTAGQDDEGQFRLDAYHNIAGRLVPYADLAPRSGHDVQWIDYNGDGLKDIWIFSEIPDNFNSPYVGKYVELWRQDPAGKFTLDAGQSELETFAARVGYMYSSGTAWGDFDSDGDPDLFLSSHVNFGEETQILMNDSGVFHTAKSTGFEGRIPNLAYPAFGDMDGDGDLDLVAWTGSWADREAGVVLFRNTTFAPGAIHPARTASALPPAASVQEKAAESRLILVVDVSGSMGSHVVPANPPEEARAVLAQIEAIDNDPQVVELNKSIDAILELPEVRAAGQDFAEASYTLMLYMKQELSVDLNDILLELNSGFSELSCYEDSLDNLALAESLEDVNWRIEADCGTPSASFKNRLARLLFYMDDPGYQRLAKQARELEQEYFQVRTDAGYSDLLQQVNTIYSDRGYDELVDQAGDFGLASRLNLAQFASNSILDLAELDQRAGGQEQQVGIVTFTTHAQVLQPFSGDLQQARTLIQNLEPQASTNLGGGLEAALDLVEEGGASVSTTIILLSDGQTNVGLPEPAISGPLMDRARGLGLRICTAGLASREDEVDSDLLKTLADQSGGQYLFTSSGEELTSFFIACHQSAIAGQVTEYHGTVPSGGIVEAGQFNVEKGTGGLTMALSYLSCDLELIPLDPNGREVRSDYSGLTQQASSGLHLMQVSRPKRGEWVIQVSAQADEPQDCLYHIVVSTRTGSEGEQNKWFYVSVVLSLVLLLVVLVLILVLRRNRDGRNRKTQMNSGRSIKGD